MLHLISQASVDNVVLQRIDTGDDVIFVENAIYRTIKNAVLSIELQQMLKNRIYIYVLADELCTRGINTDELVTGIEVIDYSGLVELTEKNKVIRSWR